MYGDTDATWDTCTTWDADAHDAPSLELSVTCLHAIASADIVLFKGYNNCIWQGVADT